MRENQGSKQHDTQNKTQQEVPKNPTTTNTDDEYIDFEEVK